MNQDFFKKMTTITNKSLYEDLYAYKLSSSFIFKQGSKSAAQFGHYIQGWIHFNKYDVVALQRGEDIRSPSLVKIVTYDKNMDLESKRHLRYTGIPISDIKEIISYLHPTIPEYDDSGNKILNNVFNVPFEKGLHDWQVIFITMYLQRISRGENLFYFEKHNLIAMIMAVYDLAVPNRLLKHFKMTAEEILGNEDLMLMYLSEKEKRTKLNTKEIKQLRNLNAIRDAKNFKLVMQEYFNSKSNPDDISLDKLAIAELGRQLLDFRPKVVGLVGRPTYVNEETYIHICARHIAGTRLSCYANKTLIPYKFSDLFLLMEKIQERISEELASHFKEYPDRDFYRKDRMAIEYNGDHYCIRINPDGRIVTFYPLGNSWEK